MEREDWDERYAANELVWSAEPNRWVREELTGMTPGRALDLAAGEGRNSLWMASAGWRVTVADFSGVAIEKGRQLAGALDEAARERLDWVVADVRSWSPEPAAYDLVLLCYLQVPEADRRAAFDRAVAALAPGGTLLVVGHALSNLTEGTGGPKDPAVLYAPGDVVAELPAGNDLVVERADEVRRPVEGERDAIDVLVRARRPGEHVAD